MFRWATNTFESLAQTVAPPPTDPYSRIYLACQKREENIIIEIIQSQQSQGIVVHPTQTIIHESKGYTLFHLACLYSLSQVIEYCFGQLQQESHPSYYYLSVRDKEGNTPLHCAAMSNQMEALDIIKRLISIESSSNQNSNNNNNDGSNFPPIITVQNSLGKTPYDVATVNSVRQYLLPIQLQAETQMAINNGGIGLPPGIDMGGLTIPNAAHLPPPPTNIPIFGANVGGGGGGSMYAPIPGLNVSSNNPSTMTTPTTAPMAHASMYPPMTAPQQLQEPQQYQSNVDSQFTSPVDYNTPSAVAPLHTTTDQQQIGAATMPPMPMRQEAPPQRNVSSSSTNELTTPSSIPRPPNSTGSLTGSTSSYALTGRSSAAIFSKSSRGGIQPDGFHSSSSDKNLQEKYGHVNVSNTALPPPPSSGNYTPDMTANSHQQPLSAPPSMSGSSNNALSSSYVNPFAGGMATAASGALRTSARRYVTYDPIAPNRPSQQQMTQPQQPASMYSPYNQFQQPQQPMQPQPFNPAFNGSNFQQPQQPASLVSFTIPPAPISGPNSTNTFSSPNAFIGKTPANTPMLSSLNTTAATTDAASTSATSTFMSPPPSGMAASFGNSTTQPVTVAPQSFASSSSPDRSGSGTYNSNTAASVFGTPPSVVPVAASPQVDNRAQIAQSGYHRSNSTPSDAAALFSKPITTTVVAMDTMPATHSADETVTDSTAMQHPEPQSQQPPTSHTNALSDVNNATGFTNTEDDDDLDDVPLTPGQNVTANVSAIENVTYEHAPEHEQPPPTTNAVNTLISAIGMPPPPFSRK